MRIISGRLGGRRFDSPQSFKTHPMSDKIRGALFNILGDIEGLTVLDAFAGSGAISFEALSRGARQATLIDNDRTAQRVIGHNIKMLQLETAARLIKASANAWLQTNPQTFFDIVICDPPFNDLQPNLIARLAHCIAPQGLLVVSWPAAADEPRLPGFKKVAHHTYGDAQLVFFSRAAA